MTRECREFRRWLSIEIDGELDAPRREALRGHLESCSECRAERRLWLEIRAHMQEEEAVVGDGVVLRVLEGIRARREAQLGALPWIRRTAVAAALLLLASVGALWFLGDRPARLAPQASDDLGRTIARERAAEGALGLGLVGAKVDEWGDGK